MHEFYNTLIANDCYKFSFSISVFTFVGLLKKNKFVFINPLKLINILAAQWTIILFSDWSDNAGTSWKYLFLRWPLATKTKTNITKWVMCDLIFTCVLSNLKSRIRAQTLLAIGNMNLHVKFVFSYLLNSETVVRLESSQPGSKCVFPSDTSTETLTSDDTRSWVEVFQIKGKFIWSGLLSSMDSIEKTSN